MFFAALIRLGIFFGVAHFATSGSWQNWDVIHYLNISIYGYSDPRFSHSTLSFMSRFPPLYPLLVRYSHNALPFFSMVSIAQTLSIIGMLLSSGLLYIFMRRAGAETRACWIAALALQCFPLAYFGNVAYSEGVHIFVFALYLLELQDRRNLLRPGIMLAVMFLIRTQTILFLPAHFYYIWHTGGTMKRKLLAALLPVVTFLAQQIWVLYFLKLEGYITDEPSTIRVGHSYPFEEMYLILLKLIHEPHSLGVQFQQIAYFIPVGVQLVLWALLYSFYKRLPREHFLLILTHLVFFALAINGQGIPRYTFSLLPIYIWMGLSLPFPLAVALLLVCLDLQCFYAGIFFNGPWAF